MSKLASKRPEITRAKVNDYLEIKKMIEPKTVKSHLDKDLNEDVDYTIKPATKQISLRSTTVPKVKVMQSIKKKSTIQPKLERFFMKANLTYSTTYEKANEHSKTKELHTSSYKRIEHQVVELPIWATSKEDARIKFENEITNDMEERDNYKKIVKLISSILFKKRQRENIINKHPKR